MRTKIYLEPSEEGGYTVIVPSLPGCISEGNTKEEAIRNIKDLNPASVEFAEDLPAAGRRIGRFPEAIEP